MPKKKTPALVVSDNRSDLVRQCLAMGLTQNNEIHAVIRAHGKTVTDALIYQLKYAAKKGKDGGKRGKKAEAATPAVVQKPLPAKRGPKPGFKRKSKAPVSPVAVAPVPAVNKGKGDVRSVVVDAILRFGFADVREALHLAEERVRQVA